MEKRYKLEGIEKYSEQWKESKASIEKMTLIGALSLAAVVAGIGNYTELLHIPNSCAHNFIETSSFLLTGIGIPVGFVSIKDLIESIREKTILEKRIDEFDLLEEQEESKTRGRR